MEDNNRNQYRRRTSKADTILLIQGIADLEHEEALARKLMGQCGKNGNFYFTLRRLASGGSPTYSPKLIGKIEGDASNSTITIRFRIALIILIFAGLMATIVGVQLYKYMIHPEEGKQALLFAIISVGIFAATILTHFYLKNELKKHFIQLIKE